MQQTSDPVTIDPFESVRLGRSSVHVTRVGLGLRKIGRDPDRTHDLLMRAVAIGLRYFDVAPTYGTGIAERRLGDALPILGRESIVISTKVGQLLRPPNRNRRMVHALMETVTGGGPGVQLFQRRARRALRSAFTRGTTQSSQTKRASSGNPSAQVGPAVVEVCDYSYDGVMRGLEESLVRLATDRVDLVFIHDPDVHHRQAIRGAYRALDSLRKAGTIGAVGVGMNQAEMLVRFAEEGDFDAFLIAGRYSLLDQSAAERLFPVAAARKISIIAAGIFNGGILADPAPGAEYDYAPATSERLRQAHLQKQVCERYGVTLKAAALQFPFAHPAVTSVLLGSVSADELDESISLLRTPAPPELWTELQAQGLISRDVPVPA